MKLIVDQLIFLSIIGAHFVQLSPLFGSEKGLDSVSGGITGISSIPGSLSKSGSTSTSSVRSVKGNRRDSDKFEEDESSSDEKSQTTTSDFDPSSIKDLDGDTSDSGLELMSRKLHKTSTERKKDSGSSESEDGLESGSSSGHKKSRKGDFGGSEVDGFLKQSTDNFDSSTEYLDTSDRRSFHNLPSDGFDSFSSDFESGSINDSDSDFDSESFSNKKENHKNSSKHNSSSLHTTHGKSNQHKYQSHSSNQGHSSHTPNSGHSHHNSSKTASDSEFSQKSGSDGESVDDFYESISAASSLATTKKSPKSSEASTEVTVTATTPPSEINSTTIAPETVNSTESNVGQSEENVTTASKNLTSSSWSPFSSSSSSSSSSASTEKPLSEDSEDDTWSNLFAGSYWDKSKMKAKAESKSTPSPSTTTTSPPTDDMNGSSNDTLAIDLSPVNPSPKVKSEINNIVSKTYSKSKEYISNLVQTMTQSLVNIMGLLNKKD